MAVLTGADYGELRNSLYQLGKGKEELKALDFLPNKSQFTAAFQTIEDFWEANEATLKASVDTAIGVTTTAPLAKEILAAWLLWKVNK